MGLSQSLPTREIPQKTRFCFPPQPGNIQFSMNPISIPTRCRNLPLLVFFITLTATLSSQAAAPVVSLAGEWRFQLDRADVGLAEQWFARSLAQHIQLPGTLQNEGMGDDVTPDTKWTGAANLDIYLKGQAYAKYREPGNVKVPFGLQPEKHYVGVAWYQRDIDIPAEWQGRRVVLTLERAHWETRVWVDGKICGTNDSLATPHEYDLGTGLAPGRHSLTVCVDNRLIVPVGDWSHSVSDHTQGNWNGLVGRLELSASAPVWIDDLAVFPQVATQSIKIRGSLGNCSGSAGQGKIIIMVVGTGAALVPAKTLEVTWQPSGANFETDLSLGADAPLWDEFAPRLLELNAELVPAGSHSNAAAVRRLSFGLREIATTPDRLFTINGRKTFFRGTLECCIFPLTGHPPTEVEEWRRILQIAKAHGLNHLRFHSWCPPEAAFIAGDELGFYYQVECGVWTNPGEGKRIGDWIYTESQRIVRAYGNHPSFVLLTHGNEPHGTNRDTFLTGWVNYWKARDPRRLVTSGSAYPQLPENQYHVHYTGRGPSGWNGKDYRQSYAPFRVPVIIHEMGQWCVYPNFDEIAQYTGPFKAKNFEIFRDSLTEHGMIDQWRSFLRASGKLQALCYKEEVEAAMRTPGVSGVQLLDLHDFPGQGTALVGVLDAFWHSKGYIRPEEFRRFYGPTVPLTRLAKRVWSKDETLSAEIEMAHFGAAPIEHALPYWQLTDAQEKVVAQGELPEKTIPVDRANLLGRVTLDLTTLEAPRSYQLSVGLKNTAIQNHWNIWIYPAQVATNAPGDVRVFSALDADVTAHLERGGKVLLLATRLSPEHPKGSFTPIFWNRYMFNSQACTTLGLLCDPQHPALRAFPTDFYNDWQWEDLCRNSRACVLDSLPQSLRPIVQYIDDWNTNRKLGLVWECRVGRGKLLVCSADLEKDLDRRPAARQLRRSLLDYMASDIFQPNIDVSPEQLSALLGRSQPSNLVKLGAKIWKADSEDRLNGHTADQGIDGDPATFWHTRWQPRDDPMPHYLIIDLGRALTIKGLTYLPRQDMTNGRVAECQVFAGDDPNIWAAPIATTRGKNTDQRQSIDFTSPVKARYLKFQVTAEINNNPFAAVAELDVILDAEAGTAPLPH
jgi:beta-galactosidase